MIDKEKKSINRPYSRSTAGKGGIGFILFGCFSAAMGSIPILAVAGVINSNSMDKNAPDWVIYCVGGIFVLVSLWLIILGLQAMSRESRRKRIQRTHPDQPWRLDCDWDERRADDDGAKRVRGAWFGVFFFAIFLAPFNGVAFMDKGAPLFVRGIIGFFDLIFLFVVSYAVHQLLQRMKYGRSFVRYESFPMNLGERATFHFSNARGIGDFENFEATLRCIQERVIVTGSGKNRSRKTVYDQIYADAIKVEEGGHHRGGNRELEFTFELPKGDYSTRLAIPEPRYWELEILAKTPGVDYCARFLLPVYGDAAADDDEELSPSEALAG